MKTILILVLVLLTFGTSDILAADSATASTSAGGAGSPGNARTSAFVNANTQGSGAAIAAANNAVTMNNPGVVTTAGVGNSVSINVDTPLVTVGVSNSVAVSHTVSLPFPNTPNNANSGGTGVLVGSTAGGTGSAASAQTSQTGSGYQVSKDAQSNIQVNIK